MDTVFPSPDIATCIGCGVDCGVLGDFGLADPLCPACAQSAWQWDAERTISDSVSIILGRPPFDCLSSEDRQELLNQFFTGIEYVPQAVAPHEAEAWHNPPVGAEYRVHFHMRTGETVVITWHSLESAKASIDRIRADGGKAVIEGCLY